MSVVVLKYAEDNKTKYLAISGIKEYREYYGVPEFKYYGIEFCKALRKLNYGMWYYDDTEDYIFKKDDAKEIPELKGIVLHSYKFKNYLEKKYKISKRPFSYEYIPYYALRNYPTDTYIPAYTAKSQEILKNFLEETKDLKTPNDNLSCLEEILLTMVRKAKKINALKYKGINFTKLNEIGFQRWIKGDKERLYIEPTKVGLKINPDGTSEINNIKINKENTKNVLEMSFYIDVNAREVFYKAKNKVPMNIINAIRESIYAKSNPYMKKREVKNEKDDKRDNV